MLGDDALLYIAYVMIMRCLSVHPLSQLLGGAAVHPQLIAVTAAPPSSWDKGCTDKHHRISADECIISLI